MLTYSCINTVLSQLAFRIYKRYIIIIEIRGKYRPINDKQYELIVIRVIMCTNLIISGVVNQMFLRPQRVCNVNTITNIQSMYLYRRVQSLHAGVIYYLLKIIQTF